MLKIKFTNKKLLRLIRVEDKQVETLRRQRRKMINQYMTSLEEEMMMMMKRQGKPEPREEQIIWRKLQQERRVRKEMQLKNSDALLYVFLGMSIPEKR